MRILGDARTSSTFLEPQLLENLFKLGVFAHIGQLHMHTCAQASAQVGWTGEDVAQVLVPHERMAPLLEQALDLKTTEPQCKQNLQLRANVWETSCVLPTLVRPVQKRLNTSFMLPPFCMEITRRWSSSFTHTRNVLLSLCLQTKWIFTCFKTINARKYHSDKLQQTGSPDAPGVGPVTGHPRGQQQRRHGFVKQEVVVNELLLLSISHVLQGVVFTLEVPAQ